MPETLLATKLYLPPLPPRVLQRQSLLDLLESGLTPEKRLILVCASAGYGKTTLVCEWLENHSNVCWVSLEKSDNDPRLFFSYLIAALQRAFPGFGRQAQEILATPQLPPLQTVLSPLLNELAEINKPCILVLDDYQTIHAGAIHEGVTFLLDHLPPDKHIVITTRSDPALPLHRYRSRGQILEIRADHLRFSVEEVSDYMNDVAGIPLSSSGISMLEKRTEGWAVGLQMAAISLRGTADREKFIRSLAGTNRYILDYLLEEVLQNLPDSIQRFLMQTAILDRFCAPLCSALTEMSEESSQEILQNLEHANLFLIPLDDERTWYRYHHLFQDLLTMRLKQSLPGQVKSLHQRAANWYESNGSMSEAVQHYIEAADFERAADLVEQHTVELFAQGKLDQLVGWIRKLPSDLSARRPWLSIYQAWALAFAGKNQEAESLIEVAIQGLEKNDPSPDAHKKIWAEIHGIRALLSITSGDLQRALAFADVLDEFPKESLFARNVIVWALGYAWRLQGELSKATAAFQEVLAIGRQLNNMWVMSTGFADLAMVLRLSGRLREAEAIYRENLEMMRQAGAGGFGYLGRSQSFLANLLCELDQLEESWQLTLESIAHGQLWNNPNHLAHAHWTEARILYGKGDTTAAGNALKKAEDIITSHPAVVPNLCAVIETFRVRLLLAQGRLTEANDWVETHPLSQKTPSQNIEVFDVQTLTHARVLIAQEKFSMAWKLLEELENSARAGGQKNTLIETLTLKSLATPKRATALEILESALKLGIPAGYRRTFLDEGDRLIQLLGGLRGRSALVEPLFGAGTGKPKPETLLTTREIDILRAMAEGLSNKEIGQRLFISTGTVKAHSAAIYRKLEVVNRTEAIARAKDLGLL